VLVDETRDENRISDRVRGDGIRPIMSLSTRRVCLGSTGDLSHPLRCPVRLRTGPLFAKGFYRKHGEFFASALRSFLNVSDHRTHSPLSLSIKRWTEPEWFGERLSNIEQRSVGLRWTATRQGAIPESEVGAFVLRLAATDPAMVYTPSSRPASSPRSPFAKCGQATGRTSVERRRSFEGSRLR
jgi:hypothetical protein